MTEEQFINLIKSLNPCFNGRCTRTVFGNAWIYGDAQVLILVLMEDALALVCKALLLLFFYLGLNPCFNGRCTRTNISISLLKGLRGLNPCFNGRCTRTKIKVPAKAPKVKVLILVLMEDALARRSNSSLRSSILMS